MLYGYDILRKPESRAALIEAAVVLNAAWTAYCLRREFHEDFLNLGVVYGAYDLTSRYVRLPLSVPGKLTDEKKGLFAPPENVEEFRDLALRICSGKLVQSLLGQEPRMPNFRIVIRPKSRTLTWTRLVTKMSR
jgi:hypothetical protein